MYGTYTRMVREAGGLPVVLVPGHADEAVEVLDRIDGLLLTGGGDVDPAVYGGSPHESVYSVDPLRDEFEIALVLAAAERRMPTLGICRGLQVANVALGGTLYEDIKARVPGALEHRRHGPSVSEPQHRVELEPDSTTATAIGKDTVEVNTVHHQALHDVADRLRVTGRAPDGVIESVEPIDTTWPMWAVQWHPEYLGPDDEPSLSLFRAFVAAARSGAAR